MIKRAERMQPVRGFGIDRVAAAADTASSSDRPVLRMENLDTNLPLPPEAVPATVAGLQTPQANSWLPFIGDLELRAAVSDFTAARTGHHYDPEREIVITSGGMEGLLDVVLALIDPGDEVIVTDPTYAGIVNRIRLAGGVPRFAPFRVHDREWRLDRDALVAGVNERTAGFLLMSPSMPSGGWLDEDDWRLVCDLSRERNLALIYDAAMERLLFDERPLLHPLRFDGMAERAIVVGSMSKEHRMIGWRVGWVCGPATTVEDVGWVHVYNTTMPNAIARTAASAVLRGNQDHVQQCIAELQRRRDCILDNLPHWPFIRPAGGWSLLLDVAALGYAAQDASPLLLEQAGIAATAMVGWGDAVAARHVRFVFSAEPLERLKSLPERLARTKLAAAVQNHTG